MSLAIVASNEWLQRQRKQKRKVKITKQKKGKPN